MVANLLGIEDGVEKKDTNGADVALPVNCPR